jgi:phosphatidylethanolamine-binding protein (PEBP) family uncharacterized protein
MADESKLEQASGIEHSYCDFTKWRVNPDVIPSDALTLASVKYKQKEITLGQTLSVKDTQAPPEIHWSPGAPITGTATQLYTLIMCDPDASSAAHRNWCHWLVVDIPDPSSVNQGRVLCPYKGPSPPPNSGLNRYVFLVYPQMDVLRSGLTLMTDAEDRKSWGVETFLKDHCLTIDGGVPIAGQMFRCQSESDGTEGRIVVE